MRRRTGLALIAGGLAALALRGGATAAQAPGLIGVRSWTMDDPLFGGFSALHVFPGGERFLAVTDRGAWTQGQFARDGAGTITAVSAAPMRALDVPEPDPPGKARRDAEGVAVAPDGAILVSFEGPARVLRYEGLDGPARALPGHAEFRRMPGNGSLEALAVGPDGALYTLPERSGRINRPYPVYRFRGGEWDRPFELPRRGDFLAVGADIGPDGRFYLLERNFAGIRGFATRLRRFDLAGGSEEVLIESPFGRHDNLEGVSIWRDGSARLVATMISDDNLNLFQRTEFVEYALPG